MLKKLWIIIAFWCMAGAALAVDFTSGGATVARITKSTTGVLQFWDVQDTTATIRDFLSTSPLVANSTLFNYHADTNFLSSATLGVSVAGLATTNTFTQPNNFSSINLGTGTGAAVGSLVASGSGSFKENAATGAEATTYVNPGTAYLLPGGIINYIWNTSPTNGAGAYLKFVSLNSGSTSQTGYFGLISVAGVFSGDFVWGRRTGSATTGESMRLTGSGRLGIGIPTPSYLLDVGGDARTTGGLNVGTATGAGIGAIKLSGDLTTSNSIHATTVTATSYIDYTPIFTGSATDALDQIYAIRADGKGGIDHATLPPLAQTTVKCEYDLTLDEGVKPLAVGGEIKKIDEREVVKQIPIAAKVGEETKPVEFTTQTVRVQHVTEEKPGRDIGAMVTVQTAAIKGLYERAQSDHARIEELEKQVMELTKRLDVIQPVK